MNTEQLKAILAKSDEEVLVGTMYCADTIKKQYPSASDEANEDEACDRIYRDAKLNAAKVERQAAVIACLVESIKTMKSTARLSLNFWNANEDSKVGKYLIALSGGKGILPDVESVFEALTLAEPFMKGE